MEGLCFEIWEEGGAGGMKNMDLQRGHGLVSISSNIDAFQI